MSVEIEVKCARCGAVLDAKLTLMPRRFREDVPELRVEPCTQCVAAATDAANGGDGENDWNTQNQPV